MRLIVAISSTAWFAENIFFVDTTDGSDGNIQRLHGLYYSTSFPDIYSWSSTYIHVHLIITVLDRHTFNRSAIPQYHVERVYKDRILERRWSQRSHVKLIFHHLVTLIYLDLKPTKHASFPLSEDHLDIELILYSYSGYIRSLRCW
jgi:hypothetical protein